MLVNSKLVNGITCTVKQPKFRVVATWGKERAVSEGIGTIREVVTAAQKAYPGARISITPLKVD